MGDVQETQLPGVGIRYDFVTGEGQRVGVLVHRSGRRELLLYDREDPDSCSAVVRLELDDTRTLTDLLGASHVSEQLAAMQQIEGLTIDWLTVPPTAAAVGRSLRDAALRSETGVSIVAIVRGNETVPAPAPDFTLEPGDTAVVVGTPEGIERLAALLHEG
jgi:K+:H+ antiporter subunit KhtT